MEQGRSLRYVLIGCSASIASTHLAALARLPGAQVVGMSDINAQDGAARAAKHGCTFFPDHRDLLAELRPDVAVICTPPSSHASLALDCFAAGAHVLVEPPMAIEVAEADTMIAVAEAAGRCLAVNLQQRFRPNVTRACELIASGELGTLLRVMCVVPSFRTATYYRAVNWRGTWRGGGGGVLMSQAPDGLDLLCHLLGMPQRVWGWTHTQLHAIECEDTAQAMLEYPGGVSGYLHITSAEAGLERRIQIVGAHAGLELLGSRLVLSRFDPPLDAYIVNSPSQFGAPSISEQPIRLPHDGSDGCLAVHEDLQRAIRRGHSPRLDGGEGMRSLELANAIIYSSHVEHPVTLPLDRGVYTALLAGLKGA